MEILGYSPVLAVQFCRQLDVTKLFLWEGRRGFLEGESERRVFCWSCLCYKWSVQPRVWAFLVIFASRTECVYYCRRGLHFCCMLFSKTIFVVLVVSSCEYVLHTYVQHTTVLTCVCLCVHMFFVCVLLLFFSDCRIYLFSSLAARVFKKLTRYTDLQWWLVYHNMSVSYWPEFNVVVHCVCQLVNYRYLVVSVLSFCCCHF